MPAHACQPHNCNKQDLEKILDVLSVTGFGMSVTVPDCRLLSAIIRCCRASKCIVTVLPQVRCTAYMLRPPQQAHSAHPWLLQSKGEALICIHSAFQATLHESTPSTTGHSESQGQHVWEGHHTQNAVNMTNVLQVSVYSGISTPQLCDMHADMPVPMKLYVTRS